MEVIYPCFAFVIWRQMSLWHSYE
uniref:Uncharacterized protein n=1 Tax=Anguilla anguilla TaxID=7936 RepID=A0A0E9PE70_ANGAN